MALTQSLLQIRTNVRKFANAQGTTALLRHPDPDVNDYINRALGSLQRKLTTSLPSQRFLASSTFTTSRGVSTYGLGVNFDHLISIDITANGHRSWLTDFEMFERPNLLSPDVPTQGIPYVYRLEGDNIELLPTPLGTYTVLLWYVPSTQQFVTDGTGDASLYDTISRLDDYLIAYASRLIAIKDKNFDLVAVCKDMLAELDAEIAFLARNRDRNSPPRITDVYQYDRWGRMGSRWGRRV